jgi:mannitol/fructose-specific phosphotransferase system IIA component (Ntr-type)
MIEEIKSLLSNLLFTVANDQIVESLYSCQSKPEVFTLI